jgi:hypothetical protein
VDEVTHKKLAALDRFMDKMLYASWSGMPVVAMALYKALRVQVLLDTTTGQDIRGEFRGVPDRGHRRRRPGEEAHHGGESRSWNGATIAGRERPYQGLEGFQGAVLIVYRDRRETNDGRAGPAAGSETRRGPVLESVDARPSPTTSRRTRYPRPAGAPGFSRRLPDAPVPRSTRCSRSAHRAPQHPSTRPLTSPAPDSNIHTL